MTSTLNRGSIVSHRLYGLGTILDEWGSWFSCRFCHIDLGSAPADCPDCNARNFLFNENLISGPLQVSGKGTFDVLFQDGKTRAINQHWLKPLEEQEVA